MPTCIPKYCQSLSLKNNNIEQLGAEAYAGCALLTVDFTSNAFKEFPMEAMKEMGKAGLVKLIMARN